MFQVLISTNRCLVLTNRVIPYLAFKLMTGWFGFCCIPSSTARFTWASATSACSSSLNRRDMNFILSTTSPLTVEVVLVFVYCSHLNQITSYQNELYLTTEHDTKKHNIFYDLLRKIRVFFLLSSLRSPPKGSFRMLNLRSLIISCHLPYPWYITPTSNLNTWLLLKYLVN